MKKVIVAPLYWGLGHASRCVPIIHALKRNHFTPVLASDGEALYFLQKEFPELEVITLPSYQISYGKNLKWSLVKKLFSIQKVVKQERKVIDAYVENNSNVVGIISDNRFSVRSHKVPSVYITHQLNVLSGFFTPLTSFIHQRIIRKFDECWIPDEPGSQFSGKLSLTTKKLHQKYIGILSRFKEKHSTEEAGVLIVLSGPEPNRSELERRMIEVFKHSERSVTLVRGKVESEQIKRKEGKIQVVNYMLSEELENVINSAELVICRSGYSSVMDLVSLGKKALLIPTEGQNEQEYLGRYLQEKGYFSYVREKDFSINSVELALRYDLKFERKELEEDLFGLFKRK